jgi:hypothetical protein
VSDNGGVEPAGGITEQSRGASSLRDFAVPLPRLADADADMDLDGTFGRLGELLGAVRYPMVVAFHITEGDQVRSWFLDASSAGCNVSSEAPRRPDVEAILDLGTWQLMASGGISPLEAFLGGRMRVRGSTSIARRFVRGVRVAGSL